MSSGGGKFVSVVSAQGLKQSGGQTDGMVRMNAITGMSDQLCGTVMIAKPHSSSAVHHHGVEDTIVYAVKGRGTIVSDQGKTRQDLTPGDFALIPAFTLHQEVNDGDEEVVWTIVRGGREPVVKNLDGWNQEVRRMSDASHRGPMKV